MCEQSCWCLLPWYGPAVAYSCPATRAIASGLASGPARLHRSGTIVWGLHECGARCCRALRASTVCLQTAPQQSSACFRRNEWSPGVAPHCVHACGGPLVPPGMPGSVASCVTGPSVLPGLHQCAATVARSMPPLRTVSRCPAMPDMVSVPTMCVIVATSVVFSPLAGRCLGHTIWHVIRMFCHEPNDEPRHP